MIPIFKTCYSLGGRSILTLEDEPEETGPKSIFDIAKRNGLEEIHLVEDTMTGFLKAYKNSKKLGFKLRFGLRMSCVTDVNQEDKLKTLHKVILMAKNNDGLTAINKISTIANLNHKGLVDFNIIRQNWNGLYLVIPYYDSFLMNNLMTLNLCVPDLEWTEPVFLRESNGLPFEFLIDDALKNFNKYEHLKCKSIYYENRADFKAWQTFKCMNRKGYTSTSLEKPELEHCGADSFCMESWIEDLKNEKNK